MLYEFHQTSGNSTVYYIVRYPRIENGMHVAEVVGICNGFSEEHEGEMEYVACQPRKIIMAGNFVMVEYTRELIAGNNMHR